MSAFRLLRPTPRKPRVEMSPAQVALILALEPLCRDAGLWVVCTTCAKETQTHKHLTTDNSRDALIHKCDCPCTERWFRKQDLPSMKTSGDLLLIAEQVLAGTGLAVRCPVKPTGCLTTPLEVTPEVEGVTARCQCWQINLTAGVYRFRKRAPQVSV